MHARRLITGFLSLPLLLSCVIWEHGDWLSAFVAALAFFFARAEMYSLMGVKQRRSLLWWQNALALLFFAFTILHRINILFAIAFLFYWGSCLITMRHSISGSRHEIAAHGLALVYILFPLASFVYLRSIDQGHWYLYFMLSVSCYTDIGAYYGGRRFGKHKLAPVISPNKTWEGSFCGTGFAILVIFATVWCQSFFHDASLWLNGAHTYGILAMVTIVMSAIGQVGDLCESAMKRDAGVKDSGSDLTGHGGFLDIMDAMLWIGPAMFVYVMLVSWT
ncbi:MAG: hypothetical protein C4527_03350 [Candidatus Omnitrophota bacterium]|jgi:phosphatidate cytidylyltransferase|nr:MAG: hypothetical protein C4527_03350 [Candidatus Omnitrophota bacterium]